MFKEIYFSIPIKAAAKQRARFYRGRVYTPKETKSFEKEVRWHWKKSGKKMIPVVATDVYIFVYLPKPKTSKNKHPIVRPDADNMIKSILDALNGHAWKDDAQITRISFNKLYAKEKEKPRISIFINQVNDVHEDDL